MDAAIFPAHIRKSGEAWSVQSVADHCRHSAVYAENSARDAGLGQAAYLAALLHDMGKCRKAFRDYITTQTIEGEVWRGERVIHTFQGVHYLMERFHESSYSEEGAEDVSYQNLTAELLAYAVGAHHGQFDCVDEKRNSGFLHRMEAENLQYEQSVQTFLQQCADENEVGTRFQRASEEIATLVQRLDGLISEQDDGGEGCFYLGLTARLLLSAVIEGDRRDTAEFMNGSHSNWNCEAVPWGEYLSRAEQKLSEFPADTAIQQARRQISLQCRQFAQHPGGVYRLNVPTGGGKTLSALRYALAHAAKWGKRRIIFTSPLLSILEQNAKVIRDYLQADELILEHHSNVVRTKEDGMELDGLELRAENWNALMIVTTLVQLLNTLFSGKTTCIRRFQALCNSIIVIDEVQTVPNHMLSLFNLAVNYLAEICQTTIVLCSATQPYLEGVTHPICRECQDIVPYQKELWQAFQRTTIQDMGLKRLEEIPDAALEILKDADSLLIVCNKKGEAEAFYRTLSAAPVRCFHLSASMCMEHRRQTLKELEQSLSLSRAGNGKTVCVSTQVIEAGVDISFERVIRLAAGMDSVVQSAGRCNRNGESAEPATVYLVRCADERLRHLREIQMGRDASLQLLELYRRNPGRFDNALDSHKAIREYYRTLYEAMPKGYQDDTVHKGRRTVTLYDLLSTNTAYCDEDCPAAAQLQLRQAFKLAGSLFTVFDEDTTDVIVPFQKGNELILELGTVDPVHEGDRLAAVLEQAKGYTVSVYEQQRKQLEQAGALIPKCGGAVLVLQEGYYDEKTGLQSIAGTKGYLEV